MSRNRRLTVVVIASAVVIAVIAVVVVRPGGNPSEKDGDSSTAGPDLGFPAPDPADADADRAYLEGDGRVLLVMHHRAQAVANSQLTAAQCQLEAKALDENTPADEVLASIGGLADPVLRDAFHAERTALGVALTQCISGEGGDERAPELAPTVEAVGVRLLELGQ